MRKKNAKKELLKRALAICGTMSTNLRYLQLESSKNRGGHQEKQLTKHWLKKFQLDENEKLTDLKITTNPKQKKHKNDKD